ncbi:MAG: adenosylcobinamide-GDP ribazoletransferase [Propionibacteriaceae bacterium]|nr:adenosylcobinamide-GDP ribazoletransferase [Propionibacteriaceae bacterium]
MRYLPSAIGVFTVLPAPVIDLDRTVARHLILRLPLVGAVLGGIAAVIGLALGWYSRNNQLGAAVGLAVLAACTGAMHLDGLADTADGLGSRKPPEEALDIMRRSDIGPMGVATLVLVLVLQWAALSGLPPVIMAAALVAGPIVGRAACVRATGAWRPGARQSGFGALFTQVTSRRSAWWTLVATLAGVWAIGLVAITIEDFASHPHLLGIPSAYLEVLLHLSVLDTLWFVAAAIVALLVGSVATHRFQARFGGLTGDTFGAIIELSTLAFWLVAAGTR